ncbi:hypothetical protein BDN70DRAFT_878626 [Pholiota conissans]|uniref:Uncharacterized protein n=1 Tax=Pholiota conissans TaxID=109636 RepID=A0A9P5Z1Q0_9AGAR|nr:hypothetical protein BDN70DRAFT_878626 [Pholiota conissans]
MSFLFGSFASSSSSSGYYVPQRELTPLGLKIATFFDELLVLCLFFGSLLRGFVRAK